MAVDKTVCRIKEREVEFKPITLEIEIDSKQELIDFLKLFNGWDDNLYEILYQHLQKYETCQ